jgi:hypothetical protein
VQHTHPAAHRGTPRPSLDAVYAAIEARGSDVAMALLWLVPLLIVIIALATT